MPTTSQPQPPTPVDIFYSYAHEDEDLVKRLRNHLSTMKRQGKINDFYDRQIVPGQEWDDTIKQRLNHAQVILLLVSEWFLSSDYIDSVELKRAMERHEAGEATVIPIILRPVDWKGAPFDKLQALPTDAKPVTTWPNRDLAFENIAKGIRRVVEGLSPNP